ncbi:hypothetical protein DAPPUDRAFT_316510 [Daphnia pulex]|uniref:Uncharacterized protein n=1 Tax=Daphnia pulex TaxID=6669 RepID=E9GD54_DAPPU|nr:hypothetical protein DAPPUDRAFT_316510 [Daphnia pulex]|eukprot:EFX82752.1 hypothetical protein DAPPUDRAFT_316510 [Daphnia pulex]
MRYGGKKYRRSVADKTLEIQKDEDKVTQKGGSETFRKECPALKGCRDRKSLIRPPVW